MFDNMGGFPYVLVTTTNSNGVLLAHVRIYVGADSTYEIN